MMNKFLLPNWPAPARVKAYTTLRFGGVSQAPYDQFNLAEHVGDNSKSVQENRNILKKELKLPSDPIWIQQTHSTYVVPAVAENCEKNADAAFSDHPNRVCIILTADCLPILLCHRNSTHVAAIHAGWRGLAGGIIQNTLQTLSLPPDELLVWLGPAISQANYEVGDEVREIFIQMDPQASQAFIPSPNQRWLADLYALARLQLKNLGIHAIYGGNYCTYSNKEMFFSYRRDGSQTGRMATLIWNE